MTFNGYIDFIKNWDFKTEKCISDEAGDIWYDDNLTDEVKEIISNLCEFLRDFTIRNKDYVEDKCAFENMSFPHFPNIKHIFRIDDQYYCITEMYGQGTVDWVEQIDLKDYKDKVMFYFNCNTNKWTKFSLDE